MKYHIEELLKDEKIECHETRGTTHDNKHILLHFFITTSTLNKNSLPKFKLGYEQYETNSDTIEHIEQLNKNSNDHKKEILCYAFISPSDIKNNNTQEILFSQSSKLSEELINDHKNEWTGENSHQTINAFSTDRNISSSMSSENISTNKNLRYVSEMDDNSIYNTDDKVTEENYLATKDASLNAYKKEDEPIFVSTAGDLNGFVLYNKDLEPQSENQKKHSIWRSHIHFGKFEKCSNEDLLNLFERYKYYHNTLIPVNLETESKMNIDMEFIFGTSFDLLRIKNNLINKKHNNDHFVDL